jgi:hypothetical protein
MVVWRKGLHPRQEFAADKHCVCRALLGCAINCTNYSSIVPSVVVADGGLFNAIGREYSLAFGYFFELAQRRCWTTIERLPGPIRCVALLATTRAGISKKYDMMAVTFRAAAAAAAFAFLCYAVHVPLLGR